jgi:hypothetical protein
MRNFAREGAPSRLPSRPSPRAPGPLRPHGAANRTRQADTRVGSGDYANLVDVCPFEHTRTSSRKLQLTDTAAFEAALTLALVQANGLVFWL